MKTSKRVVLGIVMFINMHLFAQDPNYSGAAKMEVKTFWRQADMFKKGSGSASNLSNMEKALKTIKEKDPAYGTASMEAEVSTWKSKVGQDEAAKLEKEKQQADKMEASHNASWDKINAEKLLNYLFQQSHTVGTPNSTELLAALNEYKAKTEELLAMNFGARDRTNNSIKMTFLVLDSKVSGSKNAKDGGKRGSEEEKTEDTKLRGDASEDYVKSLIYRLQLSQAYWDAARKLFPQETEYANMYQKRTDEVNKFGTVEQIQKSIQTNNAEYIKNTKMPEAVVKDAQLENFLSDGFNKKFGAEHKVSALKVVLTQDGWTTIRNPLTSVITGRERSAKLAYKGGDGKCYLLVDYIFIHEEYIGASFTNAKGVYGWLDGKEILCEHVK
jgi:hypothetical protein